MKNKVAFETELYVCVSNKLMLKYDITYIFSGLFNDAFTVETTWRRMIG
jgi:hypothetical protein